MKDILSNPTVVKRRITNACEETGRNSSDVKLLSATKTVRADKIKYALAEGETLIGENKVQELKELLKYSDYIQSVDGFFLAHKLQKRLDFEDKTMDIFIQVNTSYEKSKFGIEPEKTLNLALKLKAYERINKKDLMTIGLFSAGNEKVRKCFRLLKIFNIKC